MGSFPLWCSATIRSLALAQFATIIVCLPLVWIVANAMPQLVVDSQLKQSFSCHTKDVQEFGTTGCSCGKEATLHDRRTLLEDGESRTVGRSTEGDVRDLSTCRMAPEQKTTFRAALADKS